MVLRRHKKADGRVKSISVGVGFSRADTMSLMNVYREQGVQPEKRILKRLSERMGVKQKERDIRDSPMVGLFIL